MDGNEYFGSIFVYDDWLIFLYISPSSQGQANANDWVAEAVKDVNILTRSSSATGYSPSGMAGSLTDSETAATLLPILQAQRERFRYSSRTYWFLYFTLIEYFHNYFPINEHLNSTHNHRQRNQELEALNLEQQQQMAILHSEVERLRTDNAALYGKVRFLQSYSGQVY